MLTTLGILQNIGIAEWIVIGLVMLLLFGKRLPEVGKSLGKGIVEFKKGLKGVEDDVETRSNPGYQQPQSNYQQQLPSGQPQTMPPIPQGQPGTVGRADSPH